MSGFVCGKCGVESVIFPASTGGAARMCEDMQVPLLARLPLDPRIARACDDGRSFIEDAPDSPATAAYLNLIAQIKAFCVANA